MKAAGFLLVSLAAVAFLTIAFGHLNRDLWWDECTSLDGFALQSFATTVTSYPEPNNHILFNLFDNALSRAFGRRDIFEWMDGVWILRSFQLLFGMLTVVLTFLFARRVHGSTAGILAAVALATSVPFLNTIVQLRGYGFSMLFGAGVLYFGWSFSRDGKKGQLAAMIASGFCMLYTIPSNIYFLLSLGAVFAFRWIRTLRVGGRRDSARALALLAGAGASVGLAVLAYLPVLGHVINNKFLERSPDDRLYVFRVVLPGVLEDFFSARYFLLFLFLAAILGAGRALSKPGDRSRLLVAEMLFLLGFPFILSFLRNDLPFDRTFVILMPVFSVLLAVPIASLAGRLKPRWEMGFLIAVFALCIATAWWEMNGVQKTLDRNLETKVRAQDLYHNYFQGRSYTPKKSMALLADREGSLPGPIVLWKPFDRISVPTYLKRHGLKCYMTKEIIPGPVEKNGVTYSHDCTFYISSPGADEETFGQARIPMNLPDLPKEALGLVAVVRLASKVVPGDCVYVVTAFSREFRELCETYFRDVYDLEQLTDFTTSSSVFRMTQRSGG